MSKSALSKILIDGNRNPRDVAPDLSAAQSTPGDDGATPSSDGHSRRASLYDDTLSNRSEARWNSWIWGLFALIVVGGVVAVFLGSSADERVIELAENKAKATSESELSRMVSEVRDRDAASEETSSSELQLQQPAEGEKPAITPAAAPGPEPAPPPPGARQSPAVPA